MKGELVDVEGELVDMQVRVEKKEIFLSQLMNHVAVKVVDF